MHAGHFAVNRFAPPDGVDFGGKMDAADDNSYRTCALREISEEVTLPPSWSLAVQRAVLNNPLRLRLVQPSRSAVHELAVWLVDVDPLDPVRPQLNPSGLAEVRTGSLRWRDASDVIENLMDFRFARPHADLLLSFFYGDAHE